MCPSRPARDRHRCLARSPSSRAAALCLLISFAGCAPRAAHLGGWRLQTGDVAAVRAGVDRYRVAWLANDADAVLAEFEDEGVLMPPGKGPVVGKEAIRAYWWPPQSVTTITGFDMVIDEVAGYGDLAVVRGHDRVEWLDAEHQRAESWSRFVTELVRSPGGRWRIRGQSWVTAERPGR